MAEKQESILYIGTHANDDPERASLPFVLGNAALAMDVKVMVILQIDGVYLAKKGFAEHMPPTGSFPPLKKLISDFLELGGVIRVCMPCIKERSITEANLLDGVTTTAGAQLNLAAMEANAVLVF
jgi:uncharacterized protein involved in oxidation of intracellular sulfur